MNVSDEWKKIVSGELQLQHDSRNYAAMSLVPYYMSRGTRALLSPTNWGETATALVSVDCNPSASKYTLNAYKLIIKLMETEFETSRGRTLQSFSDTSVREWLTGTTVPWCHCDLLYILGAELKSYQTQDTSDNVGRVNLRYYNVNCQIYKLLIPCFSFTSFFILLHWHPSLIHLM